ncbi:MAG: hypothetical protein PWQ85_1609 [Geotoga sp.]|nr:hypothetical protein [Geotoga sp.]
MNRETKNNGHLEGGIYEKFAYFPNLVSYLKNPYMNELSEIIRNPFMKTLILSEHLR